MLFQFGKLRAARSLRMKPEESSSDASARTFALSANEKRNPAGFRFPVVRAGSLLPHHLASITFQRLAQHADRTLQILLAKHIGDAHLVATARRVGVEPRGGSQHHRLALVIEFAEAPRAETVAVVDRQPAAPRCRMHPWGSANRRPAGDSDRRSDTCGGRYTRRTPPYGTRAAHRSTPRRRSAPRAAATAAPGRTSSRRRAAHGSW